MENDFLLCVNFFILKMSPICVSMTLWVNRKVTGRELHSDCCYAFLRTAALTSVAYILHKCLMCRIASQQELAETFLWHGQKLQSKRIWRIFCNEKFLLQLVFLQQALALQEINLFLAYTFLVHVKLQKEKEHFCNTENTLELRPSSSQHSNVTLEK